MAAVGCKPVRLPAYARASMREPDYRATRLESLKLLERRRASYDVAMWQAPTLTVLSQTFLLTILSDHDIRFRVALWAAIAGWVTLGAVAIVLWQLRDRELHFSGRISALAGSLGMEWPTRRHVRRKLLQRPLELKAWVLWYVVFAAFAVADYVALCGAHHPG